MKAFADLWKWLGGSPTRFYTLAGRATNKAYVNNDTLIIALLKGGSEHRRAKKSVENDFVRYPGAAGCAPTGDTRYVFALIRDWKESPQIASPRVMT